MKVGVIIPDRGDRPQFLENCLRMLRAQTYKGFETCLVNHKPKTKSFDLTERIRLGFEYFKERDFDCVLIIENDDFYSEHYIDEFIFQWKLNGKPEILGTDSTVYYHIIKKQYRTLRHEGRASLMNTLISCKAKIKFPKDSEIFLDLNLWKQLDGKVFSWGLIPYSIGIKHGHGLCGGRGHKSMKFDNDDFDSNYLKRITDKESFEFYQSF